MSAAASPQRYNTTPTNSLLLVISFEKEEVFWGCQNWSEWMKRIWFYFFFPVDGPQEEKIWYMIYDMHEDGIWFMILPFSRGRPSGRRDCRQEGWSWSGNDYQLMMIWRNCKSNDFWFGSVLTFNTCVRMGLLGQ